MGRTEWDVAWTRERETLRGLSTKIREMRASLDQENRLRGELADVSRKLEALQAAGNQEILQTYQRTRGQTRQTEQWARELSEMPRQIESVAAEIGLSDLDNQLIYKLLTPQLIGNKPQRQVIVVTHNANIVVKGDAELVVALKPNGGQARADASKFEKRKEAAWDECGAGGARLVAACRVRARLRSSSKLTSRLQGGLVFHAPVPAHRTREPPGVRGPAAQISSGVRCSGRCRRLRAQPLGHRRNFVALVRHGALAEREAVLGRPCADDDARTPCVQRAEYSPNARGQSAWNTPLNVSCRAARRLAGSGTPAASPRSR